MSMTDPVADFLTRIRNAGRAQHDSVAIPDSGLKRELARILQEQGYIEGFSVAPKPPELEQAGDFLHVRLRYTEDRRPVISHIQRVSRPGRRVYAGKATIPKVLGGMGTSIVSTSRGVMTGHEARSAGVGGEVLAEIY